MTYEQLNTEISKRIQNQQSLFDLRDEWKDHIKKLDQFIEMFLDRFAGKVAGDYDGSPEWKLYKTKCDEYHNYARALRNIEYFIAKEAVAHA
jgi:hypothetical protein